VIENCTAETTGGGISMLSDGLVERCVIFANAADDGGGIAVLYGATSIEDCVITWNLAASGGGILVINNPPNRLRGCTISGNFAGDGGGVWAGNRAFLDECIVWNNSALGDGGELELTRDGADIRCCDIDSSGVDLPVDYVQYCIFTDPIFCNPNAGDWTLRSDSPCLPEHSPCGLLIGALGLGCEAPSPTGACCLPDGSCLVAHQADCEGQHGVYQGDGTGCIPNPCKPVPVESTSWGRIKARFR
jgi:hypothetical protein